MRSYSLNKRRLMTPGQPVRNPTGGGCRVPGSSLHRRGDYILFVVRVNAAIEGKEIEGRRDIRTVKIEQYIVPGNTPRLIRSWMLTGSRIPPKP